MSIEGSMANLDSNEYVSNDFVTVRKKGNSIAMIRGQK